MTISTKLLREITKKGWGECCMVDKKAILKIADELDTLRSIQSENRKEELADHLRKQAKIFREEDPQACGAKELEDAASILESRACTLTDIEIRRLNSAGLEAVRAKGIESFSIDWWPAFTRYILEHAPNIADTPGPTHAEIANAATKNCLDRTGADGWIFANTEQLLQFINELK